ncbi:PRD domain-containing protein [Erysipelothrix piscisicarius]|uniref:PRD domain-containing protein n=1 Tax=Erysipelothrix piscisicarius TaxID=2485784 RepID=UPI002F92BA17
MHITKIFNNNCVATFIDGEDMVVTGSGIGFQHKIGDEIDASRIEKMFKVVSDSQDDFEQLLNKIPVDYFEATRAIVEYAHSVLDISLSDTINVALTDHIYYAVLRSKEDVELPGLFTEEIKMYYPDEFKVGTWALNYINKRFEVSLPQDEIGYLVIHIVNASNGNISSTFPVSYSSRHKRGCTVVNALNVPFFTTKCIKNNFSLVCKFTVG